METLADVVISWKNDASRSTLAVTLKVKVFDVSVLEFAGP
jgi:hypothetical protein